MSGIEKRTFSLPAEHTAFIDAQVNSGSYASASEVIRAGLRALQERDAAVERWLTEEVARTFDEVKSGKVGTRAASDVFDELRMLHKKQSGR